MKHSIKTVFILLVGWTIGGCERVNPEPSIPEKNFERTVFTEPEFGRTITLISDKECEIQARGGSILLAEHSRQDNKLRVVTQGLGTSTVTYYDIIPDGLRDPNSGAVFLLPESLTKWHEQAQQLREQARLAKEAEEAREQAAREVEAAQKRATKQAILKRFIDNGDGSLTDVKTGLMWTKNEIGRNSWTELANKARDLRIGGHSDWRLPTRVELETIIQEDGELVHTEDHRFFSGENIIGRLTILSCESVDDQYAWGYNQKRKEMDKCGKWFQDKTALGIREERKSQ